MSLVVRFFYLKDWVLSTAIPCKQSGPQMAAMTPRTAGYCLISLVDDLKRAPSTPSSPLRILSAVVIPASLSFYQRPRHSRRAEHGGCCLPLRTHLAVCMLGATCSCSASQPHCGQLPSERSLAPSRSFPGVGKCLPQYLSRYFLNTKYL